MQRTMVDPISPYFPRSTFVMKKVACPLFIFSLFTIHYSLFTYAADWPFFRGNAEGTAYTQDSITAPLTLKWQATISGGVMSSPVAGCGQVFVGGQDGKVYAYDMVTGTLRWSYAAGGIIRGTPAVDACILYVTSTDKNLYAINAQSGTLVWKITTGGMDESSPVVIGNNVYLSSGYPNKSVLCMNKETGASCWNFTTEHEVYSSPVVSGTSVYVGTGGKFSKLDSATGSSQATLSLDQSMVMYWATPAVSGGKVFALPGDIDLAVYAWDAASGSKLWKFDTGTTLTKATQVSSPAVGNGLVYAALGFPTTTLYALNEATGAQVWSKTLGASMQVGFVSSPAVSDNTLYIASGDKNLYVLNATTGATLETKALSSASLSSPAVANGMVFTTDLSGGVYAYEGTNPVALKVTTPAAGISNESQSQVTVSGTITAGAQLTINGSPVDTSSGNFSASVPLSSTTNTISFDAQDGGGKKISMSRVLLKDTTAPTGSLVINSNADRTTSPSVTLSLSATDDGVVTEMSISNDAGTVGGTFEAYSTSKTWTLASGDGTKTVYVKFKDSVGNISSAFSDSIILDSSASLNNTVTASSGGTISGGGTTLEFPASSLSSDFRVDINTVVGAPSDLSAEDFKKTNYLREIVIKDTSGNKLTGKMDKTVPCTFTYTDADITGVSSEANLRVYRHDGTKWNLVSGQTMNASANTITFSTDQFSVFRVFEMLLPLISGSNGGSASSGSASLEFPSGSLASDFLVDVNTSGFTVPSDPDASQYKKTNFMREIVVKDTSGSALNGSMSKSVTCAFTYADSDITGISKEENLRVLRYDGTTWQATANPSVNTSTNTITFTTSSFSTFRLFEVLKDAGPPSSTSVVINSGAVRTTSSSVTLTLSATDDTGVTDVTLSNDEGTLGGSFVAFATDKTWTLSTGDGTKTVYVKFKDSFGNVSAVASDTIILDSLASLNNALTASAGGTVNATGVKLEFPSASLSSNFVVDVNTVGFTIPDDLPNIHYNKTSFMKEIVIKDTQGTVLSGKMDKAVTVSFTYTDAEVAGISKEENLRVFRHDGTKWQQISSQSVNAATNTITFTTDQFSTFRIFEVLTPSGFIAEAVNFPNPFNPATGTKFFYRLNKAANVTVEIYTITGKKLRTLFAPAGAAGGTLGPNEGISWDGKDSSGRVVGNGVYIYRITAQDPATGEKQIVVGKMAVIR